MMAARVCLPPRKQFISRGPEISHGRLCSYGPLHGTAPDHSRLTLRERVSDTSTLTTEFGVNWLRLKCLSTRVSARIERKGVTVLRRTVSRRFVLPGHSARPVRVLVDLESLHLCGQWCAR